MTGRSKFKIFANFLTFFIVKREKIGYHNLTIGRRCMKVNKTTKLTLLISAIAALISAIVLVVVFWDKLVSLCPCHKKQRSDEFADELSDYADLNEG